MMLLGRYQICFNEHTLDFLLIKSLVFKSVHACCHSLLLKRFILIRSETAHIGSLNTVLFLSILELKNLLSGSWTVHLWHRIVHQDQPVHLTCLSILILDLLNRVLPIAGRIYRQFEMIVYQPLESQYIKTAVVNDEDLSFWIILQLFILVLLWHLVLLQTWRILILLDKAQIHVIFA